MISLQSRIKQQAHALGFELAGIAPAAEPDGFAHLQDWLAQGYAGEMDYMRRHAEARRHPDSMLPNVKSVVMVGINYKSQGSEVGGRGSGINGRISNYAGGVDYHDVLRDRLKSLLDWIRNEVPEVRGRAVIDTAPLLERDFARRAGLGWFGKNTMLLHKKLGSYFFLGALLLDLALPADEPFATAHCGSCTRCLDACPTDAFVGPYQLDARRCISYLTIELRGSIPEELRSRMDDWVFGCDICQEVCPWNRKAPNGEEPMFLSGVSETQVDLVDLMGLTEEEFHRRYRHSPIWRTRRTGLLRNAAIALGNMGDRRALAVLKRAQTDAEAIIREAARWAIAQIVRRETAKEAMG